ncbi:hypothetical protein Tco_1433900 [Tanacetum coccineum]
MLTRAKLMYYCQPNSFYSIGTNSVTNEIEPNLMVLDLILHCSADLVNMDYVDLSKDVESTKLHTPLDNSAADDDVDFIDAEDDVAHDIENFDDQVVLVASHDEVDTVRIYSSEEEDRSQNVI